MSPSPLVNPYEVGNSSMPIASLVKSASSPAFAGRAIVGSALIELPRLQLTASVRWRARSLAPVRCSQQVGLWIGCFDRPTTESSLASIQDHARLVRFWRLVKSYCLDGVDPFRPREACVASSQRSRSSLPPTSQLVRRAASRCRRGSPCRANTLGARSRSSPAVPGASWIPSLCRVICSRDRW